MVLDVLRGDWSEMKRDRRDGDIGLVTAPGAGAMGQPTHKYRTLTELAADSGGSFSEFGELRRAVLEHVDQLTELWRQVSKPTELEGISGFEAKTGNTAIDSMLAETRKIFSGMTVEIGTFGEVKKGKSTLVNALVGRKVSAVAAPPETAVPVSIENSPIETATLYLSERRTEMVPIQVALTEMTQRGQRQRARNKQLPVVKVGIKLPIEGLPDGVRIVDTPGLNDPSLVSEYDNYALSELDRVNAAIFVFCYPNGPGAQEINLLQSLGRHGVEKVFLLYNFWPDAWRSESDKEALVHYMRDVVTNAAGASSSINPDDVRIYPVNLKMAWEARENRDVKGLKSSGFLDFESDVQGFLSRGVLSRSCQGATKRLLGVAETIHNTLHDRERLTKNPAAAREVEAKHIALVSSSDKKLDAIKEDARLSLNRIALELREIVRRPFDDAIQRTSETQSREQLRTIASRLSLDVSTANSRIAAKWLEDFMALTSRCRAQLMESLDLDGWTFSGGPAAVTAMSFQHLDSTALHELDTVDYTQDGAVLGGIIGAIVTATGAGLSIATGGLAAPFVGLIFGGLLGAYGGDKVSTPARLTVPVDEHRRLIENMSTTRDKALAAVDSMVTSSTRDLLAGLENVRNQVLADVKGELNRVRALLNDSAAQRQALQQIDQLRTALGRIVG